MVVSTIIRIPPHLHTKLKKLAKEKERSMNAQMIYMLGQQLKKEEEDGRSSNKSVGVD